MMTEPEEPNWNKLIDEILEYIADEEGIEAEPVGMDHYYFSEHTRNLHSLDAFHWPDEWVKTEAHGVLTKWLEHEYEDWWDDQAWDTEGWRGWLEGFPIRFYGKGYITNLNKMLEKLYRERITETHPCAICGKQASEKHPSNHPDHIFKQGIIDPDIYPDGSVPIEMRSEDIPWKHRLVCIECVNKERRERDEERRKR